MRALCGAIITAGALIGLGLAALGVGTRYQGFAERDQVGGTLTYLRFHQLDTPLWVIIGLLAISLIIGLGIAFVGLALHHERRYWERTHALPPSPAPTPGPGVPPSM